MFNKKAELIQWLNEIGDSLPVSPSPTNLILDPVQKRKNTMVKKQSGPIPSKKVSDIQEKIKAVKTLDELKRFMETFEDCELKKTALNTVFGDGNPASKIMLIGEAPGADEDKQGLPFVGASGKLLDQMLACIGLDRAKYYITNIVPWRPPGNRNPTNNEISLCMPFVEKRIEIIQPKIIVMIGGVSAKSLLNTEVGIMRLRGQWQFYQLPNTDKVIDALPMYHPSYLLRSPGQKQAAWHDLLILKHKLQELKLLPS